MNLPFVPGHFLIFGFYFSAVSLFLSLPLCHFVSLSLCIFLSETLPKSIESYVLETVASIHEKMVSVKQKRNLLDRMFNDSVSRVKATVSVGFISLFLSRPAVFSPLSHSFRNRKRFA